RVLRDCYDLLGLISFFTVGEDEVRAWSVPRGTRAQDAAAAIHSDIARGFIRAEVVGYEELVAAGGSMAAVRERGQFRLEGKDYIVQDGEVWHFPFNVAKKRPLLPSGQRASVATPFVVPLVPCAWLVPFVYAWPCGSRAKGLGRG